jgi:hypothetical protein
MARRPQGDTLHGIEGPEEGIPKRQVDNREARTTRKEEATSLLRAATATGPGCQEEFQGDTPRDRMEDVYRSRREDQ